MRSAISIAARSERVSTVCSAKKSRPSRSGTRLKPAIDDDRRGSGEQRPAVELHTLQQVDRDQQREEAADVDVAAGVGLAAGTLVEGREEPEGRRGGDRRPERGEEPAAAETTVGGQRQQPDQQRRAPLGAADDFVGDRPQGEQRVQRGGQPFPDVARRDEDVVGGEAVVGPMPPAGVPARVEQQRQGEGVGPPQAALAATLQHVDRAGHGEGDPEAGEGDRDRQEAAGGEVPALVVVLEREQHRQPEQGRADEADLERPEQVLPGGSEEEQQDRREQRRPGPEAAAHVEEEEPGSGRAAAPPGAPVRASASPSRTAAGSPVRSAPAAGRCARCGGRAGSRPRGRAAASGTPRSPGRRSARSRSRAAPPRRRPSRRRAGRERRTCSAAHGLARPPVRATKACQEGFGVELGAGAEEPDRVAEGAGPRQVLPGEPVGALEVEPARVFQQVAVGGLAAA